MSEGVSFDPNTDVPWQEIEQLRKQPTTLLKFGRKGDPHYRNFQLSADYSKLTWYSKKKKERDSEGVSSGNMRHSRAEQTRGLTYSRPPPIHVSFPFFVMCLCLCACVGWCGGGGGGGGAQGAVSF